MLETLRKRKGFTLIEVVIVIAIGALIILVVLQAVSNAQESQRDSTRRQEASQIVAALEQFAANNQGTYPKDSDELNKRVITGGYVSTTVKEKWDGAFEPGTPNSTGSQFQGEGQCKEIGSTDHKGWYDPVEGGGSRPRDYRLWVCLEQGDNAVNITKSDRDQN
jgi:prepilin-type N-terminal cleavage/methylation domain-containing protein